MRLVSRRVQFLMVFAASLVLATSATAIARRAPQFIDKPSVGTTNSLSDKELTDNMEHVANLDYGYTSGNRNTGGSDLEFVTISERDYAVAGLLDTDAKIIEITDPANPREVSTIPCNLYQNDIQIATIGDRTYALLASDSRSGRCILTKPSGTTELLEKPIGFAIADITDPSNPKVISFTNIAAGAHNLTVHPTEPIVYVSNADLLALGAVVHIWDFSDPRSPIQVQDWNYGAPDGARPAGLQPPHDITFNTTEFVQSSSLGETTIGVGDRAYVAAINHTDILDTSDPANPALISIIFHPHINISHQADPTPNGQYLLISDEVGGGTFAPVCPGGGVHVYKIGPEPTLERTPMQVGAFFANQVAPEFETFACTAHVFRINPDGHTMAIAWYGNGVHLMDFSALIGPGIAGLGDVLPVGAKTIASARMPGADTWAAKMWCEHPGYIFANDMGRGLDVFFVSGFAQLQGC